MVRFLRSGGRQRLALPLVSCMCHQFNLKAMVHENPSSIDQPIENSYSMVKGKESRVKSRAPHVLMSGAVAMFEGNCKHPHFEIFKAFPPIHGPPAEGEMLDFLGISSSILAYCEDRAMGAEFGWNP